MRLTFKNYCLVLVVLLSLSGCSILLKPTTHYVIDVWVQPKDTTSDWGIWEFFDDNGNSLYWIRSGHVEKEFTNKDNEFAKFKNAESPWHYIMDEIFLSPTRIDAYHTYPVWLAKSYTQGDEQPDSPFNPDNWVVQYSENSHGFWSEKRYTYTYYYHIDKLTIEK